MFVQLPVFVVTLDKCETVVNYICRDDPVDEQRLLTIDQLGNRSMYVHFGDLSLVNYHVFTVTNTPLRLVWKGTRSIILLKSS